jgi:hypothetical protein
VIHLAEVIEEELKERGWTLYDVMLNSGPYADEKEWLVTRATLDLFMAIRTSSILMDDTVANTFGAAFDISPKFFWAFHNNWRAPHIQELKDKADEYQEWIEKNRG